MDELMEQFVIEARELSQVASEDILALERSPKDKARLESLFRAIHTLKGSVGLFDLGPMHEVLHAAEEMLAGARSGILDIDNGFIDPLLGVIDWTERCVDNIESTGNLSQSLADEAQKLLASFSGSPADSDVEPAQDSPAKAPSWASVLLARASDEGTAPGETLTAFRYVPHSQSFFNGDDPLALVSQISGLVLFSIAPREPWPDAIAFEPYNCNLILEGVAKASRSDLVAIFRMIPDQVSFAEMAGPALQVATEVTERTVQPMRVDPARIDHLVSIAGELVTAKNGLLPLASEARLATGNDLLSRRILASHMDIERLVGELYTAVTKARLVSLDHTFRRFPRLVRETAARLGKAVELVVEGGDLEADREIVESLFEPLLHLVRNSLDHGIETEALRVASGKSATGQVSLLARQKGDHIEVVLSDDGRGLDPDRIKEAAVAKGLLSSSHANALSDDEAIQLVFAAGFSTTSATTDLSGRGVGLDAVREAIERLGGGLEIDNRIGSGVSFRLQVPISFAMSRLIVVEAQGERYGVPMAAVEETLRLKPRDVLPIRSGEAFIMRGRTMPLVRLERLLGLAEVSSARDLRVLVCRIADNYVGIAVDAVAERTETLTRPLSPMLKAIVGVSGTTLMGDGTILLVLDLEALIG